MIYTHLFLAHLVPTANSFLKKGHLTRVFKWLDHGHFRVNREWVNTLDWLHSLDPKTRLGMSHRADLFLFRPLLSVSSQGSPVKKISECVSSGSNVSDPNVANHHVELPKETRLDIQTFKVNIGESRQLYVDHNKHPIDKTRLHHVHLDQPGFYPWYFHKTVQEWKPSPIQDQLQVTFDVLNEIKHHLLLVRDLTRGYRGLFAGWELELGKLLDLISDEAPAHTYLYDVRFMPDTHPELVSFSRKLFRVCQYGLPMLDHVLKVDWHWISPLLVPVVQHQMQHHLMVLERAMKLGLSVAANTL